jgi:hypothetical protein
MLAGADAALDIVVVAPDEQRKLRLEQLDRIIVGVAVGDSDHAARPVAVLRRAPTAVLRLDMDKQSIFAGTRYVGRA